MTLEAETDRWQDIFANLDHLDLSLSPPLSSAAGSIGDEEISRELAPPELPTFDMTTKKLVPITPSPLGPLQGKKGSYSGTLGAFTTLRTSASPRPSLCNKRPAPEPDHGPALDWTPGNRIKMGLAVVRSLQLRSTRTLYGPLIREVDVTTFDTATFKRAEASLDIAVGAQAIDYRPGHWRVFTHCINQNPDVLRHAEEKTLWLLVGLRDADIRNLFLCRVGSDTFHLRQLFLQELSRRVDRIRHEHLRADPVDTVA
jgi:hypothetical protein